VSTWVAVDWGTSSLRAALLSDSGEVIERRSEPRGILTVPPGGFRDVFDALCGGWMAQARLALVSGMAGSRQGWQEAPYCPCPAGLPEVAAHLSWIEPGRIALVPGLSSERGGVPDVMRGEEVQILGAMDLLSRDHGAFVLPGTHSKWVRAEAGRIVDFRTFMTGEFYALLRQHSILARTLPEGDAPFDEPAFVRGVEQAAAAGSVMNAAFSARTLALFDRMQPPALASYLSGLVIGEGWRAQALPQGTGPVAIIAAPELARRYGIALRCKGIESVALGDEATWRGLWRIARTWGDT
jgi:2-dehydro-3-deoxygalactonokinase